MASFRNFVPIREGRGRGRPPFPKQAVEIINHPKALAKVFKVASLAIGYVGTSSLMSTPTRSAFEYCPYDFDQIIKAIDTDSYVKQSFTKYRELMWKSGWRCVSNNKDAIAYLRQRIYIMELMMRKPFQDLLFEISDQLFKFANGFVAKARGDISKDFRVPLRPMSGHQYPISGFYVIPSETVKILRDIHNNVLAYQQNPINTASIISVSIPSGEPPTWLAEEVIHFVFDRKPGRIFGTPFVLDVLDDVIALRQIEEDIQNLVHRELFPLYKYKIGTVESPATPEEITDAASELANLRTDGGLILPGDRHDVDVIGGKNEALDAKDYLRYFQERVVTGLGLSPHHLGILSGGGNRSVTDRLDIALYDKVKLYQNYLSEMIRINIFNELLLEGGFDPISDPEDRVEFRFNEIDTDTQVKKDAATIQKWTANLTTIEEARMELGEEDPVVLERLLLALSTVMQPQSSSIVRTDTGKTNPISLQVVKKAAGAPIPKNGAAPSLKQPPGPIPSDKKKSSTGGSPNKASGSTKQVGNKVRPMNQHGRGLSPDIRHSMDDTLLLEVVELVDGPILKEESYD